MAANCIIVDIYALLQKGIFSKECRRCEDHEVQKVEAEPRDFNAPVSLTSLIAQFTKQMAKQLHGRFLYIWSSQIQTFTPI